MGGMSLPPSSILAARHERGLTDSQIEDLHRALARVGVAATLTILLGTLVTLRLARASVSTRHDRDVC